MVNACTDFFLDKDRDATGAVEMPADFSPEAVAPIVRFMYTGRLDLTGNDKALYTVLHAGRGGAKPWWTPFLYPKK